MNTAHYDQLIAFSNDLLRWVHLFDEVNEKSWESGKVFDGEKEKEKDDENFAWEVGAYIEPH